ncbi:MAG: SGNH/GDSL hydrolase family protein [Myxococcota bacterium]
MPRSRSLSLIFAAFSLALGLLLAEGMLRVFAAFGGPTGHQLRNFDPLGAKFVPHGEFGYRQKPDTDYAFSNGTVARSNSMSYRGPEVSVEKPPGTFRIVLLGGSTTRGFGVDNGFAIDDAMREILAERWPGVSFEVVNLALGGYDAFQAYERMRVDGVPMTPDLVILNTGINDVRNAQYEDLEIPGPDRRTLIWEAHLSQLREHQAQGGPGPWTRLKHHVYLARFPGFVRSQMKSVERIERMDTVAPKDDAIEYFAAQVRRTADLADSLGAALVLAKPASALRYMDPRSMSHRGYWIVDAETTEDYRNRLGARLSQLAAELAAAGRPVTYVAPELPFDLFIDDCHLNAGGNRAVAERFVEASAPFIESVLPELERRARAAGRRG